MRRFWPCLLTLTILCGATLSAHAQATSNAATWASLNASGDWSSQLLSSIFPSTAPTGSSSIGAEQTVIGKMLSTFTGYVMALAAAFVAYTTIIQITRAAENGRVLSQTTSSWAPVRLFFAIMLMLPINSGFSFGQLAVGQVAQWGIGMASSMYALAIKAVGPDAMPIAQPMIPGTKGIVAGLIENELCRALVNQGSGNPNMVPVPIPVTGGVAGAGGYITWSYGLGGNETGSPVCGTVTVRVPASGNGSTLSGVNVDMTGTQKAILVYVLSEIRNDAETVAANIWQTRQSSALNRLMGTYTTATSDYTRLLTQAATTITASLNAAMKDASLARKGGIGLQTGQNQLAALGWTSAAAYYLEIARLNGQTLSLLSATPTVNAPSYQGLGEGLTNDLVPVMNPILAFQAKLDTYVQTTDTRDVPAGNADLFSGATPGKDGAGTIEKVSRSVGFNEALLKKLISLSQGGTNQWADPILSMISLGHLMIHTALTALGMSAILSSATAATGLSAAQIVTFNWGGAAATVVGHLVVTFLATPIFYGCLAMLVPGLILAFVLPTVPFAMWLAGVAGWLILVCEAMVAVPLWAFAHLTWQGDGLHGRGLDGYGLQLNVMFRPVLMLFGLFFGYFVFSSMTWLALQGFGVTAGFVLQNGWFVSNLLGVVTLLCGFVLLELTIALLSFRLISTFPHHVIKLAGVQPAGRVDMERFASDVDVAGMGSSLRGIQGGYSAMMTQAMKGAGGGGAETGGGAGTGGRELAGSTQAGEQGGTRQLGTDATLQASSDVTPPAAPRQG